LLHLFFLGFPAYLAVALTFPGGDNDGACKLCEAQGGNVQRV
jgi:hypothetical protein